MRWKNTLYEESREWHRLTQGLLWTRTSLLGGAIHSVDSYSVKLDGDLKNG